MVFKHGLIPLEVHSWLVANLALALSREQGLSPEEQVASFYYGLVHDAGVLSLKLSPKDKFDHTTVSDTEVDLLFRLIENRYGIAPKPQLELSDLVFFAHNHAASHGKGKRDVTRVRLNERFGEAVVDNVVQADEVSSGREKFGFQRENLPIITPYTTSYVFDSPYRRHNVASFQEHAERVNQFRKMLRSEAREVAEELDTQLYDPVITESTWAVEYYLSEGDNNRLLEEFAKWLGERASKGTITVETRFGSRTVRTKQKQASPDVLCFLCGRQGRVYTGIGDSPDTRDRKRALKEQGVKGLESTIFTGKGDVTRVLGFELETWRGSVDGRANYQDHHLGVCDDCAAALSNSRGSLDGILIYIPGANDVFERYTDTLHLRRLRQWEEWSEEGLCSPDPQFFNLDTWKNTRDYSEVLGGLDERRARYERALQIYRENLDTFEADDYGVYGSAELSIGMSEKLTHSRINLAPMSYGCVKPSKSGQVVINGFSFDKDLAALILKLILSKVRLDPSQPFAEGLSKIATRVEGLTPNDLDLIVSEYERVAEALAV